MIIKHFVPFPTLISQIKFRMSFGHSSSKFSPTVRAVSQVMFATAVRCYPPYISRTLYGDERLFSYLKR